MIISHKHRFIFLHCRKAAGASVVSSLSRYLGNNDLQFSSIAEGVQFKTYPPRRVLKEALQTMTFVDILSLITLQRSFWSSIAKAFKKKYSGRLGGSTTHAPASAVAATFPDEWRDYFKFCIVRNPWDKTLSDYFWRTKRVENPPSFEQYIDALVSGDRMNGIIPANHQNWDMYTINDRVAVDFVIRFEDMASGLTEALAHTSVKWDGWLPRIHTSKSANNTSDVPKRSYRDYYTDRTAQIVAQLYEKEIKEFDYKF